MNGGYKLIYPLVSYEEEFGEGEKTGERWEKQRQYEGFMEKAKELWEAFTQGNVVKQRKKEQEQKEREEVERMEKAKKRQAVMERIRKEREAKKAKEEELKKMQMD